MSNYAADIHPYEFLYVRPFTITESRGEDCTDFIFRLELNSDNFYFPFAQGDGSDFRVAESSGGFGCLHMFISYWDPYEQRAAIYFKLPQLNAGETKTLYAFWGPANYSSLGYGAESLTFFGTAAASSEYNSSYPAENAINDYLYNAWQASSGYPQWWRIKLPNPKAIGKVSLYNYNYTNSTMGTNWIFQGSDNASDWTDLFEYDSTASIGGGWHTYTFSNTAIYAYYRIYIVSNAYYTNSRIWQVYMYETLQYGQTTSISDIDSVGFKLADDFPGTGDASNLDLTKWYFIHTGSATLSNGTVSIPYNNYVRSSYLPDGWTFTRTSNWGQGGEVIVQEDGMNLFNGGGYTSTQVYHTEKIPKEGVITVKFKHQATNNHTAGYTESSKIFLRNANSYSRETSYGMPSTNFIYVAILGYWYDTTNVSSWYSQNCDWHYIDIDEDEFQEITCTINSDTREIVTVLDTGSPVSVYTDNLCVSGTATASDSHGSYPPTNAFNGSYTPWWESLNDSTYPKWIQYQFPSAEVIDHFKILPYYNDPGTGGPRDFNIKASNTGAFAGEETDFGNWTSGSWTQGWRDYHFTNADAYTYYRVHINNDGVNGFIRIAEIEMSRATGLAPNYTISGTISQSSWDNIGDEFQIEFHHGSSDSDGCKIKDFSVTTTSGASLVESFTEDGLTAGFNDWTFETKFRTDNEGQAAWDGPRFDLDYGTNGPRITLNYAGPESSPGTHRQHNFECGSYAADNGIPYTDEYDKGYSYDSDHLLRISYNEWYDRISYYLKKQYSRYYGYKEYTDLYERVCHGNTRPGQISLVGPSLWSTPMLWFTDYVLLYEGDDSWYTTYTDDLYYNVEIVYPPPLSTENYGPDLTSTGVFHSSDFGGDPYKLSDDSLANMFESTTLSGEVLIDFGRAPDNLVSVTAIHYDNDHFYGYGAVKLSDNDEDVNNEYWFHSTTTSGYAAITYSGIVGSLAVKGFGDGSMVKDYTFVGTDDDPRFNPTTTVLASGTFNMSSEWQMVYFDNTTVYDYYGLMFDSTYGDNAKLQEWSMHETPTGSGIYTVERLRLRPSPNTSEYNYFPKRVYLYGTTGDGTWDTLVSGTRTYSPNEQWQEYAFTNNTAYTSYKLRCEDNWGGPDNKIIISEWEMNEVI